MNQSFRITVLMAYWPLLLIAPILVGCDSSDGTNRGSVAGSVTFDGAPVQEGSIIFVPTGDTKGPMSFGSIANGKYSISAENRGPVVAKHKVQIEAYRDTGTKDDGGAPLKDQVIPTNYNTQTTLVVDIVKGRNAHNFELTSQ